MTTPRTFALMLALLVLASAHPARAADEDDPEPPQADRGLLLGEWQLADIKFKGLNLPLPPSALEVKVTFNKDGTTESTSMGMTQKGTWKIDTRKKPKHLDMTGMGNQGSAIYKVEKDQLTIGASANGGQRPKDFGSAEATMVFKRAKKQ